MRWLAFGLALGGAATATVIGATELRTEIPAVAGPGAHAGVGLGPELGRPLVKAFPSSQTGGAPQNWAVVQDARGHVFVANSKGVLSYDGVEWRIARPPRYSNVTRAVAVAADGRVYAGSAADFGWLQPDGQGGYEYISLVDKLPEGERDVGEVFQIVAHGDAVYFTTGKRLLIWRRGEFVSLPHKVGRLDVVGGQVYLHSAQSPLERIEGDRLVVASSDPVFLQDQARYFGPTADGRVLVAMGQRGLFHLDPASGQLTPWATEIEALLQTKRIYRALALPDGSVAVAFTAVTGGGLALLGADGKFLAYLDAKNGLPNNLVYALGAGPNGGLWVCLDAGVAYVDWMAGATFFDQANGLETGIVSAITRYQGVFYVGNTQGLFRLVPGTAPDRNARFERLMTGGVYAFHEDEDGLFAVADHRILQLTPQGFETRFKLPSLGYAMLRSRRDPAVRWIGQDNGLRGVRATPEGWRDEGLVPKLPGGVATLTEEPDGSLLVSLDRHGFFRVTPTVPPGGESPATTARVERIAVPDEEALAGTQARLGRWRGEPYFGVGSAQGFLRWDAAAGKLVPHGALPELPKEYWLNVVAQGVASPEHLWLLTFTKHEPQLPSVQDVQRGEASGFRRLPRARFIANGDPTDFYEDLDAGVLWVGGLSGIARVELPRGFAMPVAYPLWVRADRVKAGDEVPHAKAAIHFRFAAPHAPTAEPLVYQTRLRGFEEAWSAWSGEGTRTFTNLDGGGYVFEVRARDGDGNVLPAASLAFRVLPPWWQTPWAYGGYALALVGVVFGFARVRTRALRRKNEQLEKVVALRTGDLRRQNTELARLHQLELDEKISARLGEEKARLDVLRYQLNPHFLFNALTSIRSQIPPTLGSARDTLDRLAEFCRLTLHGRKTNERTTVGEEVAMLRSYLDIEQTRMGELLSVEFAIDPTTQEIELPRLLLLPLVENALKYGQATSEDNFAIRLSIQREGEIGLHIEIANTGTWVEPGTRPGIPSLGIGHQNLQERLSRHYPGTHDFTHAAADGWVRVTLQLRSGPLGSQ